MNSYRPRILVAHPGSQLYGSDRVALDSIRAMVERGWEVTLTTPTSGPLTRKARELGARTVSIDVPVLRKSVLNPLGLLQLLWQTIRSLVPAVRLARRSGADGIYISTVTVPFWSIIGRVAGRPMVCHLHEAEAGAPGIVRKLIARPVLLSRLVISNSDFSLRTLMADLGSRRPRSRVILNPIPVEGSTTEPRAELRPPVQILFVGRLSPRKGPQVAVAAVEELTSRGLDVSLSLLGDTFTGYEWFERQLHEMVELAGLQENVRFLGFRDDVWPYLAATDIVVIPSTVPEPFGNTAVEAVVARRPVVASAIGGLVQAVGDYPSARLVEPDSPTDLADALAGIIADWDQFRGDAGPAADVARERHSFDRYAEKLTEVLTDAMGLPDEDATGDRG